jgi:hypothetical protein
VIGTGSLDGFAAGALMSVVCAMAITAPRRARQPSAAAAEVVAGGVAAEAPRGELAGVTVETRLAIGAEAERLARPEDVGAQDTGCSAGGRYGSAAAGYGSRHRPADPIPVGFACGRSRHDAHPDIEFSDAKLVLVPFASPRRPEARRLPRHAAPSIGLGSRIARIGSRMTGLFATRALVSGARG